MADGQGQRRSRDHPCLARLRQLRLVDTLGRLERGRGLLAPAGRQGTRLRLHLQRERPADREDLADAVRPSPSKRMHGKGSLGNVCVDDHLNLATGMPRWDDVLDEVLRVGATE